VDINSAGSRDAGIADEQLERFATFESSPNFDRLEKAVLRYAEEMSRTPASVSDETFAGVRSFLTDEQLVELTAAIALENLHARFNCAFKLESDGLCPLPADHPVRKAPGHVTE
jgi:alkylhydroperoxidase family enzyme